MGKNARIRSSPAEQSLGAEPVKSLVVPVQATGDEVTCLLPASDTAHPRMVEQLTDLAKEAWLNLRARSEGEPGHFEFHVESPEPVTRIPPPALTRMSENLRRVAERVMAAEVASETAPMPHEYNDWNIEFKRVIMDTMMAPGTRQDENPGSDEAMEAKMPDAATKGPWSVDDIPTTYVDADSEELNFPKFQEDFDPALLLPYAGQWVAWSPDGRSILAHGVTMKALREDLADKGSDTGQCAVEYIDGRTQI